MSPARSALIWGLFAAAVAVPVAAAAVSPLLAWRQPVYIAAGFAGVIAMALLLTQPLLAGGYLPGLPAQRGRRVHRWTGGALIAAIAVHVAGLWITSPPDMVDALLFASPTPFSAWGVAAMWTALGAALLAAFRARFRRKLRIWRRGHTALVSMTVIGSVAHAMMIEGTMETVSKTVLCACTLAATGKAVVDLRAWAIRPRRGS
ncbi:ferric reductase-like transmembrane domain-containing protein [Leisingera sp. JC11]|uniref:ferric reductase-like transmembrane domain-containing protein n=1 Tax=Leisingera sp. JC11 TaxID=3042469 RepID=UPI0034546F03